MSAGLTAREIARALDLHPAGGGWRGTCPACAYAGAAVLNQRGNLWCASCGRDGPAEAVRRLVQGGELPERTTGAAERPAPSTADRTARALALWNGAVPTLGTPAALYLASRSLPDLAASLALRWRTDVPHPEERGRRAAMLALVTGPDGEPVAAHRTYLTGDGKKAAVEPVKASMGPVAGGAIRLHPVAPELAIGEGVESSASAGVLLGLPAWAAVSAGNLQWSLVLPDLVRAVVIAADADGPGRQAAEGAAARWRAEGRRVRIATPDRHGQDFNDILAERGHA